MIVLRKKKNSFNWKFIMFILNWDFSKKLTTKAKSNCNCQSTSIKQGNYTRCRTSEYPMSGAESSNGTSEAETNLKIALKVQSLLEQSGATVILTRSDENAIYDIDSKTLREKKVSDIKNRVKIGNESSADIFVSIHLNKIPQQQYYGWQTFYQEGNERSVNLAKSIQNNLNDAIQKENKRVAMKIDNIYIMKHVEIPTTIVECGFLSNPEEEKMLLTDEYQDKLAWGIYNGIMDYFYDNP